MPDSIFDQTETEPQNNTTAQPDQVVTASDNEEANETEEPSTQSSDSTKTDTREEQSPHLYFGKSSFISTELDSSQSLKQPLVFIKPESLGIIEFNVETEEPCYFIQVLNDKYEVVRELYNPTNTILENLEPNQYKIRVIIDSNCNQRWDFGNLLNNAPPERVIIHKLPDDIEDIILRANWVNPIGIIKF